MRIQAVYLFTIALFIQSFAQAQDTPPVRKVPGTAVQKLAKEISGYQSLKHSAFSFYVKNMGSGNAVADINSEMSIPSASTMKLVTTATATQVLGRGYRWKTRLAYSGEIDSASNTLNGDLYIIGGGDPTLGSRHYNREGHERDFLTTWADTIAAYGIDSINGRVIADASIYHYDGVPSGWPWGDIGNYYGAGPSGLTIFDNMCRLHFETGEQSGDSTMLLCITPHIPGLRVQNYVTSANSSKDNAYVYGAPYSKDWFVRGSIPKNKDDFQVKASIPDPEYIAAIELDYALEQKGVHVAYAPTTYRELSKNIPFKRPETTEIYVHRSPTLASVMKFVNQKSINLFAEHILCQISVKRSGYGSTSNGALVCMNYWKNKIDASGLFMTDGSGLSRSNAVSAHFLVDLLVFMSNTKSADGFKESLALAGKRGTMSGIGRGTAAEGRVFGKSGTMTRMKSYAGYVDTKNGKRLAYAMIINNYNCSTSQVTKYFKALMVKMANY
ncbi:MAG: D-alanyl-D-alanine carboxypeptidase/D-alanyl-D-alanine-endopeptidase [Flavobacteriales bacterium]|nr:D-alanyl-D-alanine carboxypeptidase/D-alanyl-D-alanine-endopeptidase [Flavobacteriales bacterium]